MRRIPRLPLGDVFFEGAFLVGAAFFAGSSVVAPFLAAGFAFSAEDDAFAASVLVLSVFVLSAFFSGARFTVLAAFFATAALSFLLASFFCVTFSAATAYSFSAFLPDAAGLGLAAGGVPALVEGALRAADAFTAADESLPVDAGGLEGGGGLDGGDAAGGGDGGSSEPPNFPSTAPTAIFNKIKTEFRIRKIQPNTAKIPL